MFGGSLESAEIAMRGGGVTPVQFSCYPGYGRLGLGRCPLQTPETRGTGIRGGVVKSHKQIGATLPLPLPVKVKAEVNLKVKVKGKG